MTEQQPVPVSSAKEGEVFVYVRKVDDDTRRINIYLDHVKACISQAELLDYGFAIDGTQAMMRVPVVELAEREKEIVKWLASRGYEVTFR